MNRAATVVSLVALLGFFMLYGRGVFHAAWAAAWSQPASSASSSASNGLGGPGGPSKGRS